MTLPAVAPLRPTVPCKICGTAAPLYGVVDFNKSCQEHKGFYLPLTGVAIYYHRCPECRLLFTEALDGWSIDDFNQHVYNGDYHQVDPEYLSVRPSANADMVRRAILSQSPAITLLDYGGGNGLLARCISPYVATAFSWDPMHQEPPPCPANSCHLVTAFEVLEHTPTPRETIAEALAFLRPNGVMLFTTDTCDHLPERGMDWWYIAPRNGHISIYSQQSIARLFADFGYEVQHLAPGLHLAFNPKDVPQWL